jgi:hypothetical protein
LIIVPALITYWRGTQRVQQAARVGAKEPVSGLLALVLYFVLAPAFFAYLQLSLNELWRSEADLLDGQGPLPEATSAMPPRLEDGDQPQEQVPVAPPSN